MAVEVYVPAEHLTPWRDEWLFFSKFTVRPCDSFAVAQLVVALRYKPEGRQFDFRWCH
jgi:hypothetical protein